jgi:hypothetical protein
MEMINKQRLMLSSPKKNRKRKSKRKSKKLTKLLRKLNKTLSKCSKSKMLLSRKPKQLRKPPQKQLSKK